MRAEVKKIAAAAVAAFIILCAAAPASAQPTVSAQSAVLIEAQTGKVLYAVNAHTKLPMASTTKVMTAILAIEHNNLDALYETPDDAYGAEGSSIYLNRKERLSMRDLLYGLMLSSGNDAAISIAVNTADSVSAFAELMNKKAAELGALNTNFVTPNGLHDSEHYTTAYDLALITAYAMKNETFAKIVSTQYHKTTSGDTPRTFMNKNKTLWQYEGGCGVKTGYTKAAGRCLVVAAERNGMMLIGVVLNCPNMFSNAYSMLDYGFDTYEMAPVLSCGDVVARTNVLNAENAVLELVVNRDIMIPVKKGEHVSVQSKVTINENITAPIAEGDILGELELFEDSRKIVNVPVLAKKGVESETFEYRLEWLIRRWTA